MTTILPRSAWTTTSNGRSGRPLNPARVNAITVHYPAAGNVTLAKLTKAQVANRLRGWRNYHVGTKKWADIGYNYAIDGAGRIWFLTGNNVGAHANAVGNPSSVGVLFVLGNNEQPTPAALGAFRALRAHLIDGPLPNAKKVQGHQQVPGNSTACPGAPLMAAIRSGVMTAAPATSKPSRGARIDRSLAELKDEIVRLRAARKLARKNGKPIRRRRIHDAIQDVRVARQTLKKIKKK